MKTFLAACYLLLALAAGPALADDNFRRPKNDDELRFWLDNMLVHHRFTAEEAAAATGMKAEEITAAAKRLEIGVKKLRDAIAAAGPALSRRPASADRLSRRRGQSAAGNEGQRLRAVERRRLRGRRCAGGDLA